MSYHSLSDRDIKEMMAIAGITSLDELFQSIPEELRLKQPLKLSPPLSEPELIRYFGRVASRNRHQDYLSFLGAGAYNHIIPSVVDYLSSRGEFVTPYTPYQPEVSQGTLQVIFEFQTLICQLTGMDIANASLYDGASAAAEAVLMAFRLGGKPKVLVASSLHPQYRETIRTYVKNMPVEPVYVDYAPSGEVDVEDLKEKLDRDTSAIVFQSPNFFGTIENIEQVSELAHSSGALSVVVVSEPLSLGLLEAPGRQGADIVTGEGQSFGIPVSFGGPYLGFMASKEEFIRQLPGRIAGETVDIEGRRGFVLTLSTREQHIRRERATSNICTNQAWCALRATIFLETVGRGGLRQIAWQNLQKAHYAADKMSRVKGVKRRFGARFFNEFVLEFSKEWPEVGSLLKEKKIIGGLGLGKYYPGLENCSLFCVTETHTKEEIDTLVSSVEECLE